MTPCVNYKGKLNEFLQQIMRPDGSINIRVSYFGCLHAYHRTVTAMEYSCKCYYKPGTFMQSSYREDKREKISSASDKMHASST